MKKFEEEIFGKVETMATQPGCSMTRKVWYKADDIHELSNGWVSPEDHQKAVEDLTNARSSITNLMAQLDYYKKDKRFEVMAEEIISLKSQLEKQQPEIPEVPQFVAELIKKRKGNWSLFGAFRNISGNKYDNEKLYEWVFAHAGRQEIFAQAWVNGYTVAKEKRFYLKAKELLVVGDYDHVEDLWLDFNKNYTPKKSMAHKFTQQEIDSMETGSYEQIEVIE